MNSTSSGSMSDDPESTIYKIPGLEKQFNDEQLNMPKTSHQSLFDTNSYCDSITKLQLSHQRLVMKRWILSFKDMVNARVCFKKKFMYHQESIMSTKVPIYIFLMEAASLRAQSSELLLLISNGVKKEQLVQLHIELKQQQEKSSGNKSWDTEELLCMKESAIESILSSHDEMVRIKYLLYKETFQLKQSFTDQLNMIRGLQR